MPVRLIDRRAVKAEARDLIKTASVSPLKFTALFLLIDLALDEIAAAVGFLWLSDLNVSIGLSGFDLSLSFVAVLVSLLGTVLYAGYVNYCLRVQRGAVMPYESLFDAFSFAGKVILLTLAEGLLVGLVSMLFIMVGILFTALFTALGLIIFIALGAYVLLTYAFALFHLCEDPGASVLAAMRRSREEMRGYRMQLFLLLLSFFPLLLLEGLAVGLCETFLPVDTLSETLSGELLYTLVTGLASACVMLYLQPYLSLATAGFFRRATDAPEEPKEPWET